MGLSFSWSIFSQSQTNSECGLDEPQFPTMKVNYYGLGDPKPRGEKDQNDDNQYITLEFTQQKIRT